MGFLAWIIFGALAGWLAGKIMGAEGRQGCLFNIVIGVVGAFIGGLIVEFVTGRGFNFGFNLVSLVVAVLGAVVLLFIANAVRN
ncbi:MAG: GlsB/YeaQ/YmgE family stress response membrane protein [Anaerolineae bacterium]|jgi:uncharacterized membrane protein YeaQ/YmgE (transglycosylase-associated protein family)